MNMNCKKAEEYLVDYLYQELPAKKTLEIEKHLHGCVHCTKTLESWRAIHRAYQRNAEEPQVAPYFKQKILAVAEEELSRSPSWTERFTVGLKFATIPIAIFVIVLFLTQQEKEIVMNKPQEQVAAPAPKSEVARVTRQLETPAARERKQDSTGYGGKRSEVDSATDKLQARPYDERLDKDLAQKNKEAADSNAPVGGLAANEKPPAAPAASAPAQELQQYGAQADYEEQAKSKPLAARKVSAVSKKTADEPFQKAQQELERSNMRGWQSNVQEAISLDDQKTLASKLHQEGNIYQSRGEYGKAIPNFEQVQSNYRDYPQRDDVLLRLGDSYAEVGQFDKAVRTYQQVSPLQQRVARERIQRLQKKQEAQEQLRSLGYVTSDKE
jgi:tetratricopeptide (TPR) repeat protein